MRDPQPTPPAKGRDIPDPRAVARSLTKPVVLVGLMGAGKSAVGRKLASLLGLPFTDADDAIEDAAQMSIAEMFEHFGEAEFREGERRVIARLIKTETGVIATGGGAFVDPETRRLLIEQSITVWLECDINTLVERTGRRATRPLLQNGDPRAILTRLQSERAPAYREAKLHIKSDNQPLEQTAFAIIERLAQCS